MKGLFPYIQWEETGLTNGANDDIDLSLITVPTSP